MKSLTVKAVRRQSASEYWRPAARLDACLSEGVRIVPMFWGDPSKLAPRAKAGGALVMQTVCSAEEARAALRFAADVRRLRADSRGSASCNQ